MWWLFVVSALGLTLTGALLVWAGLHDIGTVLVLWSIVQSVWLAKEDWDG